MPLKLSGFFSIYDRPHIIDRNTLRPVLVVDSEPSPSAVQRLNNKSKCKGLPIGETNLHAKVAKKRMTLVEREKEEEEEEQGLNKLWLVLK